MNRTSPYPSPNLGEENHEVMGEVNIQIIHRDNGLLTKLTRLSVLNGKNKFINICQKK